MNTIIVDNQKKYEQVYKEKRGIIITAEWDTDIQVSQTEAYDSEEKEFSWLDSHIRNQVDAAEQGFCNVPVVSFDFNRVAYLMVLAFGAEVHRANGIISAIPLSEKLSDLRDFRAPFPICSYGLYPEIFDRIERFEKACPQALISISDTQSPIDVLTSIVRTDQALLSLYTEPEAVHELLEMITDSIIEITNTFARRISHFGGFHCGKYLPFGIHVSDDNAAFLSPEIYEQFALPYINRLSREFGGIAYHCCMRYDHNLEVMAQAEGFLGLDAMPDFNDHKRVVQALDEKGVRNVYSYDWATDPNRRLVQDDLQMFKSIIDEVGDSFGLVLNVYAHTREDALQMADKLRTYCGSRVL